MTGKRLAPLAGILSRLIERAADPHPIPAMVDLLAEVVASDALAVVKIDSQSGVILLGGRNLKIPHEAAHALARLGRLAREAEGAASVASVALSEKQWDDPLLDAEKARHVLLASRRGGKPVFAALAIRRRGQAFSPTEAMRFAAASGIINLAIACREMERDACRAKGAGPLSGLPSYSQFRDLLARELSRARRTGRPLTVGVVRLLGLNQQVPLPLLAEVSLRLREELREFDTLGRHGSNEFAIALPELSFADAVRVTNRILEAVAARAAVPEGFRLVGGLACYPEDASTSERLIEVAEAVMAEAVERERSGAHRPEN